MGSVNDPTNCPHCNYSLLGDEIPLKHRKYISGTHWKLEIGIEYPEKYDGVWHFMCPNCEGTFGGREALIKQMEATNE
jgi:hypothetical protein